MILMSSQLPVIGQLICLARPAYSPGPGKNLVAGVSLRKGD